MTIKLGEINNKPADLTPWFDVESHINRDLLILFGHWAALNGKTDAPNVFALDTGCIWGNCLTAMRLSDRKRFTVDCRRWISGFKSKPVPHHL